MLKKINGLFLALIIIGSFTFIPVNAAKEEEAGIKITPSVVDELVEPGEEFSKEITIVNQADKETTLYAYLRDFKAADETGKVELLLPGSEEGAYISSWISVSADGITFAPGEEKRVPFSIKIPKETGPGGYYGSIVFSTQAPKLKAGEGEKGAVIGIIQQAASLILLQIKGKADEQAMVREFKTDKNWYATPINANFITRVENLGNVHLKPAGVIEIKNMFGKKVAVLNVNEKRNNVMPGGRRLFENNWQEVWGFGRYEADLALSYGTSVEKGGGGRQTLTMVRYFWVFPIKLVSSVGLGLLLALVLLIVLLKFYKKRAIKKAMEQLGVRHRPMTFKKENLAPSWKNYASTFFMLLGIAAVVMALLYFLLF